ncbi:MAG: ribose transport system substrate-binding protein [Frankiaceae bacterium]|nr:ribose transport system substrate-binding protein [Frankiaceae bacterium]
MLKTRYALVAVTTAALALGGCSSKAKTPAAGATTTPAVAASSQAATPAGSTAAATGKKPYIALISKGEQHQFWQAVKKGAESEAAKEGATITFNGPPTEADVELQINMLTTTLAKKPDALGFAALDSKAAAGLLDQYKAANIPVVAFDSGVDSTIPVTTASTDNKAAAAEAAKHLSEAIGGKGKVGLIIHDQTSRTGIDRRDGFVEWMKTNSPGITLLDPQYGGGDQAKSADIAKSIIAANPDIKGMYGSNEGSAIGLVKGVEESGKKGIAIVGFDSGKAQIDAINSGLMLGAVTQNPVGIGEEVVKAAMKAIKGESQPKTIDTGFYWYDKTNITDPKIVAVLYQ